MRKKISVAMAVYNGQRYLKEQVDSILCQLMPEDEIVVSIDPSTDRSLEILESYQDSRVRIVEGPGQGVLSNFENAILHTKNEIVFLCDQDDVWVNNKVVEVLACFQEGVSVVVHDAMVTDANLQVEEDSFFKLRHSKPGFFKNVWKNSYIGCCMAFCRDLIEDICPFPKKLPMHDQWIGLMAEKKGKSVFLDKPLIYYRRHETNVSNRQHANLWQMLKWRLQILVALQRRVKR